MTFWTLRCETFPVFEKSRKKKTRTDSANDESYIQERISVLLFDDKRR